jgi:hypothetical protein
VGSEPGSHLSARCTSIQIFPIELLYAIVNVLVDRRAVGRSDIAIRDLYRFRLEGIEDSLEDDGVQ